MGIADCELRIADCNVGRGAPRHIAFEPAAGAAGDSLTHCGVRIAECRAVDAGTARLRSGKPELRRAGPPERRRRADTKRLQEPLGGDFVSPWEYRGYRGRGPDTFFRSRGNGELTDPSQRDGGLWPRVKHRPPRSGRCATRGSVRVSTHPPRRGGGKVWACDGSVEHVLLIELDTAGAEHSHPARAHRPCLCVLRVLCDGNTRGPQPASATGGSMRSRPSQDYAPQRVYSGLRLRMGAASRAGVHPSPPASRPPAERGEKAERPLSPISPFPPISPPPTVVTHSADAGRSFRHRKNGKRLDSREGWFIIMSECVARPAGP